MYLCPLAALLIESDWRWSELWSDCSVGSKCFGLRLHWVSWADRGAVESNRFLPPRGFQWTYRCNITHRLDIDIFLRFSRRVIKIHLDSLNYIHTVFLRCVGESRSQHCGVWFYSCFLFFLWKAVSLTHLQCFPHLQLINPWCISDLGVRVAALCQ